MPKINDVPVVVAATALIVAEAAVALGTARGRIQPGRGVLALLAINRASVVLAMFRWYWRRAAAYDSQARDTADRLRQAVRARESERTYRSRRNIEAGPCAVHRMPTAHDGICPACRTRNRDTGGQYLREHGARRTAQEIERMNATTVYAAFVNTHAWKNQANRW